MDKILERIESIIDSQIKDFESKPLTTSFRLLIIYWIIKSFIKK